MEFRNLTPFDALCFWALDAAGHEHRVVVMKVGYRLAVDSDGRWRAEVLDDSPLPLAIADSHWGEPGHSSVYEETDLAPYKPRCDVLLRGHAHAPGGHPLRQWTVRLTVSARQRTLVDKPLSVLGPAQFKKGLLLPGWEHTTPEPVTTVPLRWEHAFGGRSHLPDPRNPSTPLLDEVCFSNPIGTGWLERRHIRRFHEAKQGYPTPIVAPQILYPGKRLHEPFIARHPEAEASAQTMATIAAGYPHHPAGFGPLGRAWAPRLALAGTYDDTWLRESHPALPVDFDTGYWNGAPVDQQCDHLPPDARIELLNLSDPALTPNGQLSVTLPGHRPFALLRQKNGQRVPAPLLTDTALIDTDNMTLALTHRLRLPADTPALRVIEARFETDPNRALLRLKNDTPPARTPLNG